MVYDVNELRFRGQWPEIPPFCFLPCAMLEQRLLQKGQRWGVALGLPENQETR